MYKHTASTTPVACSHPMASADNQGTALFAPHAGSMTVCTGTAQHPRSLNSPCAALLQIQVAAPAWCAAAWAPR